MAEFLIVKNEHFSKSATLEQQLAWTEKQKAKYATVQEVGDVICVYPNGTCKEKPSANSVGFIIKIPDLPFEQAKDYCKPLYDENKILIKRHKYRFDLSDSIMDTLESELWITVNWDDIKNYLIQKSGD